MATMVDAHGTRVGSDHSGGPMDGRITMTTKPSTDAVGWFLNRLKARLIHLLDEEGFDSNKFSVELVCPPMVDDRAPKDRELGCRVVATKQPRFSMELYIYLPLGIPLDICKPFAEAHLGGCLVRELRRWNEAYLAYDEVIRER